MFDLIEATPHKGRVSHTVHVFIEEKKAFVFSFK